VNTFAFLDKIARYHGAAPALTWGEESWTYREFHARTLIIAGNLLDIGLNKGDRVAFVLKNSPRILELMFGCFASGLVVVPINARLHPREIAWIVENSGARALVHDADYADGIAKLGPALPDLDARFCTGKAVGTRPYADLLNLATGLSCPVEVGPEDLAWLFYTSGTTGKPKGASWTHRTISAVVMNYLADVYAIDRGEAVLHAAPLSHGSGIVALPAIARGAHQIILSGDSFDPQEMFRLIEAYKVGHIAFLAPTQIISATDAFQPGSFDLSSLKAICYGGAPIYVEQLRRSLAVFGSVFAQIYGQGEAPITITGLSIHDHRRFLDSGDPRIASAGSIRTDVELRIVDAEDTEVPTGDMGEVVTRGDVVMQGYWNNSEASEAALRGGWLHTGDIGYIDVHGYLYLVDRAKDVIISGGNNIYPREVEEVLVAHPDIANAVVFGIPHDYWGEAVHAVVVCEAGRQLDEAAVTLHCAEHLAGYKKPKSVEFRAALPLSGYGKVQRKEMRDVFWQGRDRKLGGGSWHG
jgi:acyl-CoA synthetase (AMP-forming)/AMP-acid ligase II